jgi:hypothetical protein
MVMKKKAYLILLIALGFIFNCGLTAQDNTEQVSAQMNLFSWMAGKWQGEAWYIGADRSRTVITQNEDIKFKLDGAIITMEGTGTQIDTETQEPVTVFRAFGILTWDMQASKYVLRAYRGGNFIDSELVPNEDGSYNWFIDLPYGKTRYILRHMEDGTWNEKGEFSRDNGQTWMQTFEMNLKKE